MGSETILRASPDFYSATTFEEALSLASDQRKAITQGFDPRRMEGLQPNSPLKGLKPLGKSLP